MKKAHLISLCLLSMMLMLFLNSCEDRIKSLDDSFFGYEYFPIEIGKYWIYRVDSTVIKRQGGELHNSRYFVKEEIVDAYTNVAGDSVFVVQRSIADSLFSNYQIRDVWTTEITSEAAFRVEENLRFNKLSFPLDLDSEWRGNLFDNLVQTNVGGESIWVYKDWGDYKIISKGIDHQVNGQLYSDVIAVLQADHDFVIERRYAIEYYAPDIGLIDKEMIVYDTQCDCPGIAWEDKASAGFTLKQKLVEHN